ncbi:MAG: hypothetical protein AB7L17_07205 [Ilumatobacteraceae bacterium]
MLANFLPGLREVRTPLTVGYVWLIGLWIVAGDRLPASRPAGDGLVPRTFDLFDFTGTATLVALASLAAYLIGVLLTASADSRALLALLSLWRRQAFTPKDSVTNEYEGFVTKHVDGIYKADHRLGATAGSLDLQELARAANASNVDLRTRLLVANSEVFGEHDRLRAEAEFRLNLALPLAFVAGASEVRLSGPWYLWPLVIAALVLLMYRGLDCLARSEIVLRRAVLAGVVQHPIEALERRHKELELATTEQARGLVVAGAPRIAFGDSRWEASWAVTFTNLNVDAPLTLTGHQEVFRIIRLNRFGDDPSDVLLAHKGPFEATWLRLDLQDPSKRADLPLKLGPGESVTFVGSGEGRWTEPQMGDAVAGAECTFIDGRGLHWRRSFEGELIRIATSGWRD